jgi:hypothetical protein
MPPLAMPNPRQTFSWAQQVMEAINNICLALDKLAAARVAELEEMLTA